MIGRRLGVTGGVALTEDDAVEEEEESKGLVPDMFAGGSKGLVERSCCCSFSCCCRRRLLFSCNQRGSALDTLPSSTQGSVPIFFLFIAANEGGSGYVLVALNQLLNRRCLVPNSLPVGAWKLTNSFSVCWNRISILEEN